MNKLSSHQDRKHYCWHTWWWHSATSGFRKSDNYGKLPTRNTWPLPTRHPTTVITAS